MNTSFAIEGELTVFTAHEVKARLLAAMPQDGVLDVDLSEVSEFDGAGVQLLLAASREAVLRGGALRLTSPSEQVWAALQLAGLSHHFDTSVAKTQEVTP